MRKRFPTFRLLPLAAALAATSALALTPMAAPAPARSTTAQSQAGASLVATNSVATSGSPTVFTAAAPATTTGTSGGATTSGTTTSGGTTNGGTTTTTSAMSATTVIPAQPSPPSRTASGATTTEQTSGTSQSGTSTGDAFSGSSRGGAPAVGEVAANTLTTTGQPVTNPTGVFNGPTGIPIVVDNGAVAAGAVTLNGERIAANPATATITGVDLGYAGAAIVPQVGVATSATATTPAERKELRKRQNLPRNGQLLYSIAPRTNVDRTRQMPDDPISPALRPPA
jgi:hypothetical protein